MPYASASARISCILFREPASARPLAQPLQWVIQVRLVAARNVSSSSARRRRYVRSSASAVARVVARDADASLSIIISPSGKCSDKIMRVSTVPHASVIVMCRRRQSPSSAKRKYTPQHTPQMNGCSTSEQASLVNRGLKRMWARAACASACPRNASLIPLQKLAARRACNRAMILLCWSRTRSLISASCSGVPGILRGAESPFRVPAGKSSQSCTCTKKELWDSRASRVIAPSQTIIESATARACLDGERHPKPPLRTRRPPMKSTTVPALAFSESQ